MMSYPKKHVPTRRCVVCYRALPQGELLRFFRTNEGVWQLDPHRRAGGRGAWICQDCKDSVMQGTVNRKALKRFFKSQAPRVETLLKSHLAEVQDASPQIGGVNVG
ncbi:MAG: YlxR family protein [Trueperaceae bacterium]|nr:MAG: YlxR family protein [Trueperaceae bacterium]